MSANHHNQASAIRMKLVALVGTVCLVLVLAVSMGVSPAFAGTSSWWHLSSLSEPSYLPPGGEGTIAVTAVNLGDAPVNQEANPVTVTDKLPPGLTATAISGTVGEHHYRGQATCLALPALACTFEGQNSPFPGISKLIYPYEQLEMRITVKVEGARSGTNNEARITGGETPQAVVTKPITVSSSTVPFAFEQAELTPENENGTPDTQAGSHPFQLTSTLFFKQHVRPGCTPDPSNGEFCLTAGALPKDTGVVLPPGLVGNPNVLPQCTEAQFAALAIGGVNQCPQDTAMGVAGVTLEVGLLNSVTVVTPIFNLVPAPGEPARFGFVAENVPVTLDTAVRTGRDYAVVVTSHNITELPNILGVRTTFWGVPGEPSHDNARGYDCIKGNFFQEEYGLPACTVSTQLRPPAFLVMPTSCMGPLSTVAEADSWKEPTNIVTSLSTEPMESLDGCDRVPFAASIEAAPDVQEASTPTGLKVDVHVPQDTTLDSEGVAGGDIKTIKVTLPEGVTLNPAGSDGLEACSEGQIGYEGMEGSTGDDLFSDGLPAPKSDPQLPFCGTGSKIATVKITTPLLTHAVEGSVYLASQNENPFGSLVAMYLVAEDPISGFLLKLPGEVSLNPVTGQITATFENSPQLPFEDAELHFFGGDRAPLSTPALCGNYTTNATFSPWSGNAPVNSSSTFQILTGANGTPCPNPAGDQSQATLPFKPSLTAGTSSNQAGGFSPFTMTMSREDGNQNLQAVILHMPPGLLGNVSSVTPCGEAQANAGACGPESLVGETVVSVGLGSNPYTVTGGKVYLTGPYQGAPYGLSIVNPANAGPFHLGNVIVRAKIEVDPITANLTVTTNKNGPGSIPQILDGIPLQIKHINVTIGRPGFIFNPTDCEKLELSGSLISSLETSSSLNVPFQVTNCAVLGFKPKLMVATSGKTSRKNGTSLAIKIAYPAGAQGKEAWFKSAKFDFPKQLPARLTTLQQACLEATFNANPANCPPASKVGTAIVHTPVLPGVLNGVVYFVSYGGAKFPEAVIVLQGDNVTVDLHAETFISRTDVTSATLRSIPGVPFESVEVKLPSGPFSEFAANGNLCTSKLQMSTAFTAQNGLTIHQTTPMNVTNCPRAKALTRAQKLKAALKACHKKPKGSKRSGCEKAARKKYGVVKKGKKKK